MKTNLKTNFFAKTSGRRAELYFYDAIGEDWDGTGITAQTVSESLASFGKVDTLDIYINSPGGSVFDGIAIVTQLKRFDARKIVHIDGIAASIASVIAMAGDEINIADNALMMIHSAWGLTMGTAEEMRKYAESLDKVDGAILDAYAKRTGYDRQKIADMVKAETWLNADECVEMGFATKKTDDLALKAEFPMLAKFKNTPKKLLENTNTSQSMLARMDMVVLKRSQLRTA